MTLGSSTRRTKRMIDYIDPLPPFEVGERIAPTSLFCLQYWYEGF